VLTKLLSPLQCRRYTGDLPIRSPRSNAQAPGGDDRDLDKRGIVFETLDDISTRDGSTGRLALNVLDSVAQFERQRLIERTQAELVAARADGRTGGRRRKLTPRTSPRPAST
jgi:hypothetical protein